MENALEGGSSARSLGIVRVRKADALSALGRDEEAEAALRLGLPALRSSDQSLSEDRFLALMALGGIYERALDYPAALSRYRLAESLAPSPASRVRPLRGIIVTGMFYDGGTA